MARLSGFPMGAYIPGMCSRRNGVTIWPVSCWDMLGRREASSSSSGLRRSQFDLEGFEFWSSEGFAGKEILDGRELFGSGDVLCCCRCSRWFVAAAVSFSRQVVSWCLAAGEGRVVVVMVRDSELVILKGEVREVRNAKDRGF